MNVIVAEPPLFAEIDARFHVRERPVIFAWGHTIYNPRGIHITDFLVAHERVHGLRQLNQSPTIEDWWHRYLQDEAFRYEEELHAHRAELEFAVQGIKDREALNWLRLRTIQRLGAPLYDWKLPHDPRKDIQRPRPT